MDDSQEAAVSPSERHKRRCCLDDSLVDWQEHDELDSMMEEYEDAVCIAETKRVW